jgi:imidazolonepropionase-like amidohydrolase
VMDGPRIYDAKWVFSPAEGGGNMPTTAVQARAWVQDARNEGYRFIKFFDSVSRDVTLALLDEAALQGMPAIAHFQTTVTPEVALDNGLDLVAHIQEYGFDYFNGQTNELLIPAAVEMTLRNQASVTSTLIIDELTAQVAGNNQAGIAAYWERPETRWLSPESVDFTGQRINTLKATSNYESQLAFLRTLTRKLHEAGVPILMGTDAPGSGAVAGFSVHRELNALVECGIPLGDVLKISSWNGAQFIEQSLGLNPRFGAIREGWQADLVLLENNPLASLNNLKDPAGVMADGRWRSSANLVARMEAIAVSYGNR